MENKKLLKYLLKDLSELDEMFSEKGKNSFDDLEMEFIQNRVSGAKNLVQMFFEHENEVTKESHQEMKQEHKTEIQETPKTKESEPEVSEEKLPGNRWLEANSAIKNNAGEVVVQEKAHETKTEEKIQVVENNIAAPELVAVTEAEIRVQIDEEHTIQVSKLEQVAVQQELQMEDEEPVDIHHKRLGDSFLKEKSVNDIISADFSNLEHKLSNRSVTSIQSAIGINDRFQYIRELFEGSADNFGKTVADLDSMNDIKEAVNYLQTHFKWKKNETSLKFVNLIKRRFPNE